MIPVRRHVPPYLALLALTSGLGCTEHHFAICDITQRACQEDIYYRMLKLRGDGYDPYGSLPPMTVISEDTFRQQLEQEAATAAQNGPSPWDKALVLLHFTSAASSPGDAGAGVDGGAGGSDAGASSPTIEDQVAHVYAFYDPKSKTVTIIDHPNQDGQAQDEAMITLAHELVHALQDRELNLDKEDFNTSDEYFAWDAIVEGDARFYELHVHQGSLPADFRMRGRHDPGRATPGLLVQFRSARVATLRGTGAHLPIGSDLSRQGLQLRRKRSRSTRLRQGAHPHRRLLGRRRWPRSARGHG